ncbi:hypothetical protein GLYMA_02G067850v4 [Glycine max]|nr:hypothetical protein GLYMA_02G067850v4 [Glycine max]KAH1059082.1 hypothetical protein GYH30_003236 [Glycine max]
MMTPKKISHFSHQHAFGVSPQQLQQRERKLVLQQEHVSHHPANLFFYGCNALLLVPEKTPPPQGGVDVPRCPPLLVLLSQLQFRSTMMDGTQNDISFGS